MAYYFTAHSYATALQVFCFTTLEGSIFQVTFRNMKNK